ncbi:ABC transporter permease [Burkholderia gladioli]|uniref:ABC transporter permease n=1 Tax=Burkholderia gladioli TaxID=28095 RepID=UPI000D0046A9|nr:ABC transporter permease [Burkholderia gladioli]MBJ9678746.1 ABC transporter permease [Burkholderia gladioli]MBU9186388.1 ABC transporter permease [Burkholderia gladioli]MBU9320335.1 ABC transporter permease [Burkholderia gladioli]MDD1787888.1 ABC transporter permease [Burkholderia gladioli]MDN7464041.1 ABC transporter permease [Burkholderia gladioli]
MSDLSIAPAARCAAPRSRVRHLVRGLAGWPPSAWLSAGFLFLLALALAFPGWFTPHDPLLGDVAHAMQPPGAGHWFGTDRIGRDVLARVVYGARYSLVIGLASMLVSLLVGLVIGLTAGLGPRALDEGASRIFDVLSAFPPILLSLFVVSFAGQGIVNIAVAVGIAGIPKFGRVLRARTLGVRRADYVRHAPSYGYSRTRVFLRHLLPNVLIAIPVVATIDIGSAILAVSGLSFLGLGPQPPTPEWGVMLAEGRDVLRVAWWPSVFPGLAITLTVVAFTVLGKTLSRQRQGSSR